MISLKKIISIVALTLAAGNSTRGMEETTQSKKKDYAQQMPLFTLHPHIQKSIKILESNIAHYHASSSENKEYGMEADHGPMDTFNELSKHLENSSHKRRNYNTLLYIIEQQGKNKEKNACHFIKYKMLFSVYYHHFNHFYKKNTAIIEQSHHALSLITNKTNYVPPLVCMGVAGWCLYKNQLKQGIIIAPCSLYLLFHIQTIFASLLTLPLEYKKNRLDILAQRFKDIKENTYNIQSGNAFSNPALIFAECFYHLTNNNT